MTSSRYEWPWLWSLAFGGHYGLPGYPGSTTTGSHYGCCADWLLFCPRTPTVKEESTLRYFPITVTQFLSMLVLTFPCIVCVSACSMLLLFCCYSVAILLLFCCYIMAWFEILFITYMQFFPVRKFDEVQT